MDVTYFLFSLHRFEKSGPNSQAAIGKTSGSQILQAIDHQIPQILQIPQASRHSPKVSEFSHVLMNSMSSEIFALL